MRVLRRQPTVHQNFMMTVRHGLTFPGMGNRVCSTDWKLHATYSATPEWLKTPAHPRSLTLKTCRVLTLNELLSYDMFQNKGRLSQVVRRRSAKPLYGGSNPPAASRLILNITAKSLCGFCFSGRLEFEDCGFLSCRMVSRKRLGFRKSSPAYGPIQCKEYFRLGHNHMQNITTHSPPRPPTSLLIPRSYFEGHGHDSDNCLLEKRNRQAGAA
jgi:hypothetical protein